MSKAALGAAVAAVMTAGAPAAQAFDASRVTARVGGIYIVPADNSKPIAALAVPKDAIDVSNEWAPDIDFEYAVTDNIGVELLLTVPRKHKVVAEQTALGPDVRLGSVTHLPPTLTAKYYFATQRIRPYLGAGVNLTWFTRDNLAVPGAKLDVDDWSVGPALQAGVDVSLNDRWSVSLDAKRAWLRTDVSIAGGAKLTTVKVDPWILGLRFGYRFGAKPAPAPAPVPAAAPPPVPPPDSDRDGVSDANDRCPGTPAGARVDAVGCEIDSDGDGVVDRLDQCPGTPAGAKVDARGCEIVITLKGVNFETDSAKLTLESVAILDEAVAVLKQRPGASVEVQGHTDAQGKDAYNLQLSDRRSRAVQDYLVGAGVNAGMLTARGYGEAAPVASNDTEDGRAQNRRVDLKFLKH
jgi:OOP family OmpA-OmpF porin